MPFLRHPRAARRPRAAVLPAIPLRAEPLERRVLLSGPAAGYRDSAFGDGGVLRADFGGDWEVAHAVAVLADGKVLVAGTSESSFVAAPDVPAWRRLTLARYNPDGSPDPAFGTGGRVVTRLADFPDHGGRADFGDYLAGLSLAVTADGSVLVGGAAGNGYTRDSVLVRYTPQGAIDRAFGQGGIAVHALSGPEQGFDDALTRLALDEGGRILAVYTTGNKRGFGVARFTPGGALDPAFAGDGTALTLIGYSSEATDLLPRAGGGVVVLGEYFNEGQYLAGGLIGYRADGSLDPSFGAAGTGVVRDVFAGQPQTRMATLGDSGARLAALDGGAFVAGAVVGPPVGAGEVALTAARFTPAGTRDAGWASGGLARVVPTRQPYVYDFAGLAPLPGGGLALATLAPEYGTGDSRLAVARLTPGGAADGAFGSGGLVYGDLPFASQAGAVATDSGGGLLVAGGAEDQWVVRHLNTVSDPSSPVADAGGPYVLREGEPFFLLKGYSFDPDGPIASLEVDTDYDGVQFVNRPGPGPTDLRGPSSRVIAIRVTDADGNADIDTATLTVENVPPALTIGGGSTAAEGTPYTLSLSSSDPSSADAIQYWTIDWGDGSPPQRVEGNPSSVTHLFRDGPANNAVTATATDNDGTWAATVGRPDPTFGTGGVVTSTAPDSYARGAVLDADGRIVVAGASSQDFAVFRFLPDGRPDTTFGANGRAAVPGVRTYNGFAIHSAVALQPDGKILAAVPTYSDPRRWVIARLNPDGTLDGSFGTGGLVRPAFDSDADAPNDLLVQPDGRIVVAGEAEGRFAVLRLNPDGSPDTSFGPGGDGLAASAFPAGRGGATTVRLMPDGRLVAAGYGPPPDAPEFGVPAEYAVARYNPDGSLDPTFAVGGTLRGVIPGFTSCKVTAVALGDDGSVTFAVESASVNYWNRPMRVHVLRLRPDGTFDPSFGEGGAADITRFFGQHAGGLALLPDGKVLVGGGVDEANLLLLHRLLPTGAPDPSFGVGGMLQRAAQGEGHIGRRDPEVSDLLIEHDGDAILAAGPHESGGSGSPALLLARFNTRATVAVANTPPTVSVSGPSARPGVEYTLALSYADPGDDAVRHWLIDWGDGTATDTVTGPSATHAYASGGAFTVVARAVDEDGTWQAPPLPVRVVPQATLAPDGTLTVVGSPLDDAILLSAADGTLSVSVAGLVQTFAAADVTRIDVSALAGADSINVGDYVRPAAGVHVSGGEGNDTLTGASGAGPIAFDGGTGADALALNATEGDDAVTLAPGSVSSGGAATGATYAGVETLTVRTLGGADVIAVALGSDADGVPSVVLDTGAADDRVDVTTLPAGRALTVTTGSGRDAVNVGPGSLGAVTLNSDGDDAVALAGTDADDLFVITDRQVQRGPATLLYSPFALRWATLTLGGGAGNDQFRSERLPLGGPVPVTGMTFDGGAGDDAFNFVSPGWPRLLVGPNPPAPITLRGGDGSDSILADGTGLPGIGTYTVSDAAITGPPGYIPRGDVESVTVRGGAWSDTFRVTPSAAVTFTVEANDPPPGGPTGDRLIVFRDGTEGMELVPAGEGAGRYTFTNRRDVAFSGIELMPEYVAPEVTGVRFLDTTTPFLVFTFSEPVTGLSASLLTLEDLATGARRSATNVQYNAAARQATFGFLNLPDGRYRATLARGNITDASGNRLPADVVTTFDNVNAPHVAGRFVFYNNSAADGGSAVANAADDGAVAGDKSALLPGRAASFGNVSSYTRGVNGLMVDVARATFATPRAADFAFFVADPASPSGWRTLATPPAVSLRRGAGVNGTDRITLTWPDGTIRNTWLRVVVNRTAFGLPANDAFAFGNLVGETGDDVAAGRTTRVTSLDLLAVRRALSTGGAAVDGRYDFNKDGRVNALDVAAVRSNLSRGLGAVSVPVPAASVNAVVPLWSEGQERDVLG